MLAKLIKYEAKALLKIMLPVYGIAAIMLGVSKLILTLGWLESDILWLIIPSGLMLVACIFSMIAVIFITFGLIIMRFYKNMMGDEGYLMFTLPVTQTQLLISKLVCSVVCLACSVTFMLGAIVVLIGPSMVFTELTRAFVAITPDIGWLLVMYCIAMLIGVIYSVLLFYSAISIGGHVLSNRMAGSVLSYFGLQTAGGILSFVAMAAIGLVAYFATGGLSVDAAWLAWAFELFFGAMVVLELVMVVALFMLTKHFMTKKLNLA